ncbi:MAG TPA: hypothetical protein VNY24_18025 [Candidatus Acidoferrales bacterium]|jgi:hypothetical protein|nr:hypothetical protein [Candidatus Acidoferrales bacterium]
MGLPQKISAASAIAGVSLMFILLTLLNAPIVTAQQLVILRASDEDARRTSTSNTPTTLSPEPQPHLFLPLTPGTWWLYRGTVQWTDSETNKPASTHASIKMQVERVIQKPEFTIAVISGFPSDVGWSNGQVDPKPSLLIETRNHEVFLDELPPDFDYCKLEKDAASLDKFLSQENLLFRWPLKKGMKFGDAESVRRDDDHYCWVVATQETKKLDDIKGLASQSAEVFLLQYFTNPDDTEMEISPGIGILGYQYHHHGIVADTSLTLVEFHPAQKTPATPGATP